jgi:hypothetical protein
MHLLFFVNLNKEYDELVNPESKSIYSIIKISV